MKRKVLMSVAASSILLSGILFTGCFSSNSSTGSDSGGNSSGGSTSSGGQSADNNAMIRIQTQDGTRYIDPAQGASVVVARNGNSGINEVATVVHSELNNCANETSDSNNDGIICGPKSGVTYVFQSDFGKLGGSTGTGDTDGDINTPDGGVLLYDARTVYNGGVYETPVSGDINENRIREVYIPSNYIKVTDDFNNQSVDAQYDAMRSYLANVCNMQCMAAEPDNNPFFTNGVTEGRFLATYVMWFTRGTGEDTLEQTFASGNYSDLEYLTVEFELDVSRVDNNSSKLRFTSPAGSRVVFGGKKHNEGALTVATSNDGINSVLHETQNDINPALAINMAKYFDKLIEKGDNIGVSAYAKEILVDNAKHPWPVKIYGTLHQINDDGSYERSFVRNPGKLDATLFHLDDDTVYGTAYESDANKSAVKAVKFNIVYPGGNYNAL